MLTMWRLIQAAGAQIVNVYMHLSVQKAAIIAGRRG